MQTLGLIPVASEKQNSGDRGRCVGLELKPEQHGAPKRFSNFIMHIRVLKKEEVGPRGFVHLDKSEASNS